MSSASRFTAYLSAEERNALRERAADEATSENYLVRIAVRALLGLPIPRWAREELDRRTVA